MHTLTHRMSESLLYAHTNTTASKLTTIQNDIFSTHIQTQYQQPYSSSICSIQTQPLQKWYH